MLRHLLSLLVLATVAAGAWAQSAWVSIRLNGVKVGYTEYRTEQKGGLTVRHTHEVLRTKLLGQDLEIEVTSDAELAPDGQVTRSHTTMTSGGRTVDVTAVRVGERLTVDVKGEKPTSVALAKGAYLTDDPAFDVFTGGTPRPESVSFDPQNLSLVANTVRAVGEATVDTPKGKVTARKVEIQDTRATTTFYLTGKGEVLWADGPFGMRMEPTTETEATTGLGEESDLATASRIDVGEIPLDLFAAKQSRWTVTGAVPRIQDDPHQTFSGQTLTVHPQREPDRKALIVNVGTGMEEWLASEPRIPCDEPGMRAVAQKMVGGEKRVWAATQKIRRAVHEELAVNAGIGVLRDAREVWATKEGVCRDHAVLMATLLRSVNIPSRLVSGLVYQSGALYYHAWVEVWDGKQWFAADSTRPQEFVSSGHIKTAQGHLAEATGSFLLPGAKFVFVGGG